MSQQRAGARWRSRSRLDASFGATAFGLGPAVAVLALLAGALALVPRPEPVGEAVVYGRTWTTETGTYVEVHDPAYGRPIVRKRDGWPGGGFVSLAAPPRGIPGAEGWGASATTTCVRSVVYVETVESMGATGATLDSILTNAQHGDTLTIVKWRTGGWSSDLGWDGTLNCVYLAGQHSPGDGAGYQLKGRMLRIRNDSHDFVVRGLVFAGIAVDAANPTSTPNISVEDAQDWIWMENDHLWAVEKNISVGPLTNLDTVKNATIYRNIFAQAQALEPTSLQITESNVTSPLLRSVSLARNLFHSNSHRNPQITTAVPGAKYDNVPRVRAVGNLWFNSGNQGHLQVRGRMVDVLDGYVKAGPMTNAAVGTADYSWVVSLHTDNAGRPDSASSVYVERLIGTHNRDTATASAALWWDGGADTLTAEVSAYYRDIRDPAGGGDPTVPLDAGIIRGSPISTLPSVVLARVNPFDLQDELAGTATDSGQVGAYRRVQDDGTFAMRSDSAHAALLAEVRDSTGVANPPDSSYVAARNSYTKAAGTACTDSDGDGMCNAFEVRIQGGTDSTGAAAEGDPDGDGWTNAEEEVNGTEPLIFTNADGSESASTWGGGRSAVFDTLTLDTLISGTDTQLALGKWDPAKVGDPAPRGVAIPGPATGEWLLLTCESVPAPEDSAKVDSLRQAWGLIEDPRDQSVPGCP